jgi:hypothetical protein
MPGKGRPFEKGNKANRSRPRSNRWSGRRRLAFREKVRISHDFSSDCHRGGGGIGGRLIGRARHEGWRLRADGRRAARHRRELRGRLALPRARDGPGHRMVRHDRRGLRGSSLAPSSPSVCSLRCAPKGFAEESPPRPACGGGISGAVTSRSTERR